MKIVHGPDNIQPDGLMHVFNLPNPYLPYPALSKLEWYQLHGLELLTCLASMK